MTKVFLFGIISLLCIFISLARPKTNALSSQRDTFDDYDEVPVEDTPKYQIPNTKAYHEQFEDFDDAQDDDP